MLSPVGGVIVEVNSKARQNPDIVKKALDAKKKGTTKVPLKCQSCGSESKMPARHKNYQNNLQALPHIFKLFVLNFYISVNRPQNNMN